MGYCMDMARCTTGIKCQDQNKAIKAVKDYVKENGRFSWTEVDAILRADNIFELMDELRYVLKYDEVKDVYTIDYFNGEKLGNDHTIFDILAPFMTDGYIEYNGEDGAIWRYVFKNGRMREKQPKISWED
jgi:hypothetical protein